MATADAASLDRRSRAWVLAAGAACLLPLLLQLAPGLRIAVALVAPTVAALAWRGALPGWLRLLLAVSLAIGVLVAMDFNPGRDTGCALLAAMLAIKPAETANLRDARSLLGFALFAPFATFLLDQGPWPLLLGLLAVTLTLAAMARVAEAESGELSDAPAGWRRLLGAWRLLAIGLPLAMAAFWLFPRMASPLWGVPERAQARPGLSEEMNPGQWSDMLSDDTPAARVRFLGARPPEAARYWRGPVFWQFDGRSWRQAQWLRGEQAAPASAGAARWEYEIELEPTDRRLLVALDLPLQAPGDAEFDHDRVLRARERLDTVTRWRIASAAPARFEPTLSPALRRLALELPAGFNPRTLALARQWRSEAGRDDAAIVRRALAWIGDEFSYTLAVPPAGRHAVDEFLFQHKAGYCEQFSSAFAVLMRGAGIPTRVVGGYAGGYHNRIGDYLLLRRSDAHAWNEVWLEGRGWTRFDPTFAVAPERVLDTLADRAAAAGGAAGALAPVFDTGDWLRRGWNDFVLGFNAERQARLLQPLGIRELDPAELALAFALAAALALGAAYWLATRGPRPADPVMRAWRALDRRYASLGLAREPHEPASGWTARVLASRPQDTALAPLSERFTRWRYAPVDRDAQAGRQLARALRAYRPAQEPRP